MLSKINQKIILIFAFFGFIIPVCYIPTVQAGQYATRYAAIQVRTTLNGVPLATIQLWTQAQTYSPYPDGWRILHYTSYPEVQWDSLGLFVYDIIDIDWYTYRTRIGIVLAGSIWRIKLYDSNNPEMYFIFDLKVYVYAWGSTIVGFVPVSSSNNGWTHTVDELNWNEDIVAALGVWMDGLRIPG